MAMGCGEVKGSLTVLINGRHVCAALPDEPTHRICVASGGRGVQGKSVFAVIVGEH